MRVDIRDETRRVALAEREHNGVCVVLISTELVDRLRGWSAPVQVRVEEKDGVAEIVVRPVHEDRPI